MVLVARRRAALDAFASELEAAYKVQVRSIALDLAADGAPARLEELTSNIELGLVVLNAGSLTTGPFLAGDLGQELKLIELNVTSTVEMTHRFGNRLRERGRGGLILLSSVVGYGAFPYQANYAASKAYIASFGLALHEELAPAGIDVLVLAPGPTKTEGFVGAEGSDFTKLIDRTKARRSTASANDFGVKMIRAELKSGSVRSGAALFTSPVRT